MITKTYQTIKDEITKNIVKDWITLPNGNRVPTGDDVPTISTMDKDYVGSSISEYQKGLENQFIDIASTYRQDRYKKEGLYDDPNLNADGLDEGYEKSIDIITSVRGSDDDKIESATQSQEVRMDFITETRTRLEDTANKYDDEAEEEEDKERIVYLSSASSALMDVRHKISKY